VPAHNQKELIMTISNTDRLDPRGLPLQDVADAALEAFWQVMVDRYPEAETGDLSPHAAFALQIAAEDAIAEWIYNNVPATTTKGD
jgi:hypothetical protein